MAKVIPIMSMSLDGYVADTGDGVAEVFDWYTAGDVAVPTTRSDFTFHVSAPSAGHLRRGRSTPESRPRAARRRKREIRS
jgi:hypothetical protein